jgi:hypothetical protein
VALGLLAAEKRLLEPHGRLPQPAVIVVRGVHLLEVLFEVVAEVRYLGVDAAWLRLPLLGREIQLVALDVRSEKLGHLQSGVGVGG